MPIVPAAVSLNGVNYRLKEDTQEPAYREYIQPRVEPRYTRYDDVGFSRPSLIGRQDVLTWRWDDWSKGEGQRFIDRQDPDSFRRYYFNSTGAVDVLTPGQVSLGYQLTQSYASGATTYSVGPYLALTKFDATNNVNNLCLFVDGKVITMGAVDTWTDKGGVMAAAGNLIAGPAAYNGGGMYICSSDGSGAAGSSRVRKVTWDGTTETVATQQASANMDMPVVADNRLYVVYDGGNKLVLRQTAMSGTLPLAITDVYTADGTGSEAGMDALGPRIHIVTQMDGEEPRIHIYDGKQGYERWRAPVGFRMQTTPYDAARFLGDVFYMAGYFNIDGKKRSSVVFVTPSRTDTLGIIRDKLEEGLAQVLLPTPKNLLLIGTGRTSGVTSKVFVHDAANDGISQLFDALPSTFEVTSMMNLDGRYYIACRAAASGTAGEIRVYRTANMDADQYTSSAGGMTSTASSNNNRYSSSALILSSIYDLGYPEEYKLIHDVTLETEPLPSGSSVTVALVDETGTVISTDVDSNTMTYSTASGVTKTWKISGVKASDGSGVTRRCKRLSIQLTLNAGTNAATTPVVQGVTVHVSPLGFYKLYDMLVSLGDESAGSRILGQTVSGEKQLNNLKALIPTNPSSQTVVAYIPHYTTGNQRQLPEGQVETETPVACRVKDMDIRLDRKGNGFAKVTLEEIMVTN